MRHSINVVLDASIRSCNTFSSNPSFSDGCILKISQSNHELYLTHRASAAGSSSAGSSSTSISISGSSSSQMGIGLLLGQLNGFKGGIAAAEIVPCLPTCKRVIAQVSQLHYRVVGNRQLQFANEMIDQIGVVWDKGIFPLFYPGGYIVLHLQVNGSGPVSRLAENTLVQFIIKGEQSNQTQTQIESSPIPSISLTFVKYVPLPMYGHLHAIYISNEDYAIFNADHQKDPLGEISSGTPFERCPSISEFITDLQSQAKGGNMNNSNTIVKVKAISQIPRGRFSCTQVGKLSMHIGEVIQLKPKEYKPIDIGWEVIVKSDAWIIDILPISNSISSSSSSSINLPTTTSEQQSLLSSFIQYFMTSLQQAHSFVFNAHSPHLINSKLIHIALKDTENETTAAVYRVRVGKDWHRERDREELEGSIAKMIRVKQRESLQEVYRRMDKWKEVNALLITPSAPPPELISLFHSIYDKEITTITKFMQSSSTQILLVTSFPANGKSFLYHYLFHRGYPMWKIDFKNIVAEGRSVREVQSYIDGIVGLSPYGAVFIDDLPEVKGKGEEMGKGAEIAFKLILQHLLTRLKEFGIKGIFTSKSITLGSSLPSHVKVTLQTPTRAQRQAAFHQLNNSTIVKPKRKESENRKIMRQMSMENIAASIKEIIEEELWDQSMIGEMVESTEGSSFEGIWTIVGEREKRKQKDREPKGRREDFGSLAGLAEAKSTLKSIIYKPLKYSTLFQNLPIKLPRGILLYGPSGSGKSALGQSLPAQFNLKYFSVKGSDILSKYIGGSQAAVRDIFEKAQSVAPSIIFFDQFQSIVPRRNSEGTGVGDRVVNQFLCYLDGVASVNGVFIVAASSRPDLIDPAILRPGRLDSHLFLDYPTPAQREQLFTLFSSSIHISYPLQFLVQSTENYSYSDLVGLLKELRIKKASRVLKIQSYQTKDFLQIEEELLMQTLKSYKIAVDVKQQARQRKMYLAFKNGEKADISKQKQIQM